MTSLIRPASAFKAVTFHPLLLVAIIAISSINCHSQEIVDTWRYTLRRPVDGWQSIGFDDTGWQDGNGEFGAKYAGIASRNDLGDQQHLVTEVI